MPHAARTGAGLAALILVAGLSACAGADPAPPSAEGDKGSTKVRTVEHAMGKATIPADKPIERVVALDASFVDATLALETPVIGYTSYRSIGESLPSYLGDAVRTYGKDAISVGTLEEPSLSKIAALEPDLILSAKIRHEALYDKLSGIAPTVFSETTGAAWKDNLKLVGKAVGKEAEAASALAAYEARAKQVGAAIKAKNGGKMPTISVLRFTDEPTVRLYIPGSFSGIVLNDVGFPRPAGQPAAEEGIAVDLGEERVTDADADHIFIATWPDEAGKSAQVKQKFTANPLWGKLRGTRHEVDDLTWMTAVGLQGAHVILDDLAEMFEVDPAAGS